MGGSKGVPDSRVLVESVRFHVYHDPEQGEHQSKNGGGRGKGGGPGKEESRHPAVSSKLSIRSAPGSPRRRRIGEKDKRNNIPAHPLGKKIQLTRGNKDGALPSL